MIFPTLTIFLQKAQFGHVDRGEHERGRPLLENGRFAQIDTGAVHLQIERKVPTGASQIFIINSIKLLNC